MNKILLVEDEKIIRCSLAQVLSLFDYEVVEAENGKDGLMKIQIENPDLIICDVMMPEMDGYQLLAELKNDQNFDTPFIFLTANVQSEDILKGLGMGADDYIFKPFKSQDIINAVKLRLDTSDRKVWY